MTARATRRVVVDLKSWAGHMRIPDWASERLIKGAPEGWDLRVMQSTTKSRGEGTSDPGEETLAAIRDAEVYYGYGVSRELIEAAPALKWVHSASAGVAGALTPALGERGIVFTNSAGVWGEGIADTVLAYILHFARGLDLAVHRQAESRWDADAWMDPLERVRELNELTVVVIGTGGIGAAVARRLGGLGCRVIGIRRRPALGTPAGFETVVGIDEMKSILPKGDVVVMTAPLTGTTRHMIDDAALQLLPDGAIVVNVARGGVVDEAAVVRALDSGRLRGAALDVFATEPLPVDSPLWKHPRALVTPHVSGASPQRQWDRALSLFEKNWRLWIAGKTLDNIVDAEAGY
jgi:phosphoglycerate dehydrogenase-like enzyme